ncbi:MAG: efflux RND transporter periplasmic adaptor subunit, partial [Terriglobales bacterium]
MRRLVLGIAMVKLAIFGFAVGRITAPAGLPEASTADTAAVKSVSRVDQWQSDAAIPSSASQRIPGVRIELVGQHAEPRRLHSTGRVETNEGRTYRVFAGSDGRLSTLGNNAPGTIVRKGETLATFFSNDLVKAEQAYFFSLQTLERVKASNRPVDVRQAQDSMRANEEILRSLGMGEAQIHQLGKTREATRDIEIVSPADGIVVTRDLSPQQRLEREAELFRIVDLSRIWIFASVLPGETPVLTPGTKARIMVRGTGKNLEAEVSSTIALVDSDRRVLEVKLEAQNPGLLLRPDMYVDVEFQIAAPEGISVPRDAVIDGGIEKIVYVETGDNAFEPRAVELGSTFGDRVLVRRGLSAGDRVV